jgi:dihydrodipicolinate synthase/N-acetylneuraminate lyase
MNADYSVAEEALEDYVQWLMKQRVGGLAVNVEVGEGPLLSREERRRVLEIVAGVVHERVPIIAGVAANYTGDAMAQAVDAKEAGASAVMIHPNYFFVGDDLPVGIPVSYHKAIAEAAGLPVVLFQLNKGSEKVSRYRTVPARPAEENFYSDRQRYVPIGIFPIGSGGGLDRFRVIRNKQDCRDA